LITNTLASLALLSGPLPPPPATAAPPAQSEDAEQNQQDEREALFEERRSRTIELVREGEFEEARQILDELLITHYLELAATTLADERVEDGLVAIDHVLRLAPDNRDARLMKADGSFKLAENARRGGRSREWIDALLSEAFEAYQKADTSAHTLFGAARCAWLLRNTDSALEFARQGMAALQREGPTADTPSLLLPERILAETAYTAYVAARESDEESAAALQNEAEVALMQLLGRASDDPWVWLSLAELFEMGERLSEARDLLERALARLPTNPRLMEALARVARRTEGRHGVVAAFASYIAHNPSIASGYWYESLERFSLALERMQSEDPGLLTSEFERAEAGFRRCRELDSSQTDDCLSYETCCRNARGWCALSQDNLEVARREFLSMNELIDGGIEWSISGLLENGVRGLQEVAKRYRRRSDWLSAGEMSEIQRGLQPFEPRWARNAADSLRRAALELEQQGQRLCRAAFTRTNADDPAARQELRMLAGSAGSEPFNPEDRQLFLLASHSRFERARRVMERSWESYRAAVELSPEDLRLANDAAAVLVRYLHRDLDTAETLLARCIELGGRSVGEEEQRLARSNGDKGQESLLWELKNTWGDAHQNMGLLAFLHRGDEQAARSWIELANEIGPDPRPDLTNGLLPWLRGERSGRTSGFEVYARWASPCAPEADATEPGSPAPSEEERTQ